MLSKLKNIFGIKKSRSAQSQKSILVVDDSQVDRAFVCATLEKQGYQISQAVDGRDGLEKAKELTPDLIILDYEMPEMKGPAMCKALKVHPKTRDIPVIFLTGRSDPQGIIDCFEVDAENFLDKPVNPRVLNTRIKEILGL